jgi:hypothetical protein
MAGCVSKSSILLRLEILTCPMPPAAPATTALTMLM